MCSPRWQAREVWTRDTWNGTKRLPANPASRAGSEALLRLLCPACREADGPEGWSRVLMSNTKVSPVSSRREGTPPTSSISAVNSESFEAS